MARHTHVSRRLRIELFIAKAHSPWQRSSTQNSNGLNREYLPTGDDRLLGTLAGADQMAKALNYRSTAVPNFTTAADLMKEEINTLRNGAAP